MTWKPFFVVVVFLHGRLAETGYVFKSPDKLFFCFVLREKILVASTFVYTLLILLVNSGMALFKAFLQICVFIRVAQKPQTMI